LEENQDGIVPSDLKLIATPEAETDLIAAGGDCAPSKPDPAANDAHPPPIIPVAEVKAPEPEEGKGGVPDPPGPAISETAATGAERPSNEIVVAPPVAETTEGAPLQSSAPVAGDPTTSASKGAEQAGAKETKDSGKAGSPTAGTSGARGGGCGFPRDESDNTYDTNGYFVDVHLDYKRRDAARFDFTRSIDAPPIPAAMTKLIKDIQATARLIVIQFQSDDELSYELLIQLHATACSLVGKNGNVDVGIQNLDEVRENIASQFTVVREYYYWKYLRILITIGIPFILVGSVIFWVAQERVGMTPAEAAQGLFPGFPIIPDVTKGYPAWVTLPIMVLWIPAGATIGMFLDYIFRIDGEVSYDNLTTINPGRWQVGQRFVNTLVVAFSFAAAMAIPLFQIGITNILLNDFVSSKPYLAGLVGFVTAFSYSVVRDILYRIKPEVRSK
jgi:hypothetical protein